MSSELRHNGPVRELEWIKVATVTSSSSYHSFEEYVDSTHTYCKQVWDDGYVEIFELAGKKI